MRCEDCGPAGRRFFERRKGWSAGCEAGGGRREAAHAPAGGPRRGSDTRVDTGARDGRQADRRRRRGALQPALEQSPSAPAPLLRGAAARGDPSRRDPGVCGAPRPSAQSSAWRVQPALPANIQREPVQTSRDRVERLSRMGGASRGGLYVPWRSISSAGAARNCDSSRGVAASARTGGSGQGSRAGAVAAADAAGAESGADHAAGAVAARQPGEPAAAAEAGSAAKTLGGVGHARELVDEAVAQRRPESREAGQAALAAQAGAER